MQKESINPEDNSAGSGNLADNNQLISSHWA